MHRRSRAFDPGLSAPLLLGAGLALAALLLVPATTLAHAALESADPAPDSTIPETPELVIAEFTDRLDPGLSSLTLAEPGGAIVATGGVATEDPEARQMVIRPSALADGRYTVTWTAVSADDKAVETGTYVFTIATPPASAPPTPPASTPESPSASVSASPDVTPAATAGATAGSTAGTPSPPTAAPDLSPSPSPGGEGNGPGAQPIVVAIVLALVAAIAVGTAITYARRRNGRRP